MTNKPKSRVAKGPCFRELHELNHPEVIALTREYGTACKMCADVFHNRLVRGFGGRKIADQNLSRFIQELRSRAREVRRAIGLQDNTQQTPRWIGLVTAQLLRHPAALSWPPHDRQSLRSTMDVVWVLKDIVSHLPGTDIRDISYEARHPAWQGGRLE